MKNKKISVATADPTCYIHFSDGKNCNVTLRAGITVNEMLRDVAAYNQVDNQMVDWLLIGENSSDELTMEQVHFICTLFWTDQTFILFRIA